MVSTDISGTVFNIQKFSVHDGPGIRTTVFLKGCPLRCRWCSNAESMNVKPEPGIITERCSGCGYCIDECPENALKLENEKVVIDRGKCNTCGECVAVCPEEAVTIYGKRMSVEEVFKEVSKDRMFYSGSGGGVTVSGGEPLRQPEFVKELFRRCREEGIHTCLDTCGYTPEEELTEILPLTDCVLFDLKHMNPDIHREYTGVDNGIIRNNAGIIVKSGVSVLFRIPLIDGVNGTEDNIRETAEFIKSLGGERAVELLPYHRLGIGKYRTLGIKYPGENLKTPSSEVIERLKQIFGEYGVACTTGG